MEGVAFTACKLHNAYYGVAWLACVASALSNNGGWRQTTSQSVS